MLKAAANEKRLQILSVLMVHRTMEIGEVALALNLPYKTTARNLKILERFDFLESHFQNGNVFYTLKDSNNLYYNNVILNMIRKSTS
ncbi:hypothetical protein JXB22_03525 [candidate division WOR-3 bacterium]|nr:hypothetical protein [candidate division WOR-3 bacterium]